MDKPDAPAAVMGSFVKIGTMADGTPRIVLDLDCTLTEVAALGLTPGAPIAIARVTQQAAQQDLQRKTVASETRGWGHVYQDLYRLGWFNNPRVAESFGESMDMPHDLRAERIKNGIYREYSIKSLVDLEPQYFVAMCDAMGIRDTLPPSVIEAARGRAI